MGEAPILDSFREREVSGFGKSGEFLELPRSPLAWVSKHSGAASHGNTRTALCVSFPHFHHSQTVKSGSCLGLEDICQ